MILDRIYFYLLTYLLTYLPIIEISTYKPGVIKESNNILYFEIVYFADQNHNTVSVSDDFEQFFFS